LRLDRQRVAIARDRQPLAVTRDEAQVLEPAFIVGFDGKRFSGPELIQGPRRSIGPEEIERLGVVDSKAGKDAADGVASAHPVFAPVAHLFVVDDRNDGLRDIDPDRLDRGQLGRGVRDEAEGGRPGNREKPHSEPLPWRRRWPRPPRGRAGALG